MNNKYGYLTFNIKDLVATIMIQNNKTEISIDEVYNLSQALYAKMKDLKILGSIMYSNVYLMDFALEHVDDFYVGEKFIHLKNGHDINWLIENFTSYLSIDKLELLGFIDFEDTKETVDSI